MTAPIRILIIEDEAPIRRFLRASLESQSFDVQEAASGKEGLAMAGANAPDIILLDLGLPDIEGLELIRKIRPFSNAPIIIISARGKERDKIEALDAGADDYLTKPFGVGELLARIRVAMRHRSRAPESSGPAIVEIGNLRIDLEARQAIRINLEAPQSLRINPEAPPSLRAGEEIRLTPIEWKLLALLARNAGKVVTQKQLLQEVWGAARPAQEAALRVYLHQLRRKLEPDPARPRLLITEPWVGYRLNIENEGATEE